MTKKRLTALLLSSCMGLSLFTGSASVFAEEAALYEDQITLSCTTWIGYAPLFVAKEKGFFKDHGADVDIKIIDSDGDIRAAFMAGEIQGMTNTVDNAVMSKSAGLDFEMILTLDTSDGGDGVIAKKEYNSLADLKGKTVALDTTGGASLFFFNYICKEEGFTMEDFDVQNMGAGDAGSAFVAGSVEAAATWQPWLSNAENTDFGKVLYSSADYPGVIVDTLSLNSDFIEQYPGSVQAIVDGWYDALAYIEEAPEECYEIMGTALGMTAEEFEEQLPNVKYYDKEANIDYYANGLTEMAQAASDIWMEMELIETPVNPEEIINDSFINGSAE